MLNGSILVTTLISENFEINSVLDNYAKLYQFNRSELTGIPVTNIEKPLPKLHEVLENDASMPNEYAWTYRHHRVKILRHNAEEVWFADQAGKLYIKPKIYCYTHFME